MVHVGDWEDLKMKPKIVLSGVNLVEMGPLSILRDALDALAASYGASHEIVALVHRRSLFTTHGVTYLEFPAIKRSWVRRLKFEYYDLKQISRDLNADLWLSMHDTTPSVIAKAQAVYCHNSTPFYSSKAWTSFMDWKLAVFRFFYQFVYRIHIQRNDYVIVQQSWMREAFRRRFGLGNVVVAHPTRSAMISTREGDARGPQGPHECRFIYPCFPRAFKNVEVVLEAVRILAERGRKDFKVWLTFNGTENRYARRLVARSRRFNQVEFLGLLAREEVFSRYEQADCLIFASKLETWGLPITEYKPFRRPLLVADLPYAHETVGDHNIAAFFDPDKPAALAMLMEMVIDGACVSRPVKAVPVEPPYCQSWKELFDRIVPGQK